MTSTDPTRRRPDFQVHPDIRRSGIAIRHLPPVADPTPAADTIPGTPVPDADREEPQPSQPRP